MSTPRADITFRRALLSDCQAVMNIGDMYDGRDYLPAIYREVISQPDNYGVVAVAGDQVVGFYVSCVFDGGQTMMKRAARVHTDYQGCGIFQRMEAELDKYTRDQLPKVQHETIANTERVDHLAWKFKDKGYVEIYRKAVFNKYIYYPKLQLLKQAKQNSCQGPEILGLNSDDLKLLFRSEREHQQVFPTGRLFNFYIGYRLEESNIRLLICNRGGVFASLQPAQKFAETNSHHANGTNVFDRVDPRLSDDITEPRRHLDPQSLHTVAMVTFYYCYTTTSGFTYFLDIYARPEVTRDHFQAHLNSNLEVMQRHYPQQNGILCITMDSNISKDDVTSCLNDVGIEETIPGQEKWQILYERRLHDATHIS